MSLEYQTYGLEHPLLIALIVPIMLILFLYIRRPNMTRKKWTYYVTRSIYLLLLLFALASPYTMQSVEKYQDTSSVTILNDLSDSMSIYKNEKAIGQSLYTNLREQLINATGFDSVKYKTFSNGSRTEIGDALYQNSVESPKDNNLIVLVSDGNNNHGRDAKDVARALSGSNTRILHTPLKIRQMKYT